MRSALIAVCFLLVAGMYAPSLTTAQDRRGGDPTDRAEQGELLRRLEAVTAERDELAARVSELEGLLARQAAVLPRYERALRGADGRDPREGDEGTGRGGGRGGDDTPDDQPPPRRRRGTGFAPAERIDPLRPRAVHAEAFPGGFRIGEEEYSSPHPIADAYEAIEGAGHQGPVVIGVRGAVGRVGLGAGYSKWDGALLFDDEPVEVDLVGLDEKAEIGPVAIGDRYGVVLSARMFDLGIRGAKDSFAIRQDGEVGELVFDGFHVVPYSAGITYTSLFHLSDGWRSLTLKAFDPRGIQTREHLFYLKPGGRTQVLDCRLVGSIYSAVQCRSHGAGKIGSHTFGASAWPSGPIIFDGNTAERWAAHAAHSSGNWLMVWCSLEHPVVFRNNRCLDSFGGCVRVSVGVRSTNPPFTHDGYAVGSAWFEGNTFTNPQGGRDAVGVAGARTLHWKTEGQRVETGTGRDPLTINSRWSVEHSNALPVKEVRFHGSGPAFEVGFYDAAVDEYRRLTADELARMVVR